MRAPIDLGEQLLRHRKDNRFIVGFLTLLLAVFSGIYYLLQSGKGLPGTLVANRLVFFVLWYINVLLILTILFILFRSLFRIVVDRQRLGSRFKTKLVLSAIVLSAIPVLIPFPFATTFLIDLFDQWFSLPIEEVVAQAAETSNALSEQIESTNLRDAGRVLVEVEPFDFQDLDEIPEIFDLASVLRRELDADYLAVFDGIEMICGFANPRVLRRDPQFRSLNRFLREAMQDGQAIHLVDSLDIDGRLILAARATQRRPVEPSTNEDTEGPPEPGYTVAVIGTVLPADIASKQEQLLLTYQDYLKTKALKEELRTSYLLILLMVTLLVIVAFSSIGLRLARRLTAPMQALATATRRISAGDYSHRVDVEVDDELGVLVNAFNHMTEELQRNKQLVDRRSRELLEASKRIRAVIQNVAAGVLSIDVDGSIRTCNGAALKILNQGEEIVGQPIEEVWSDPERGQLIEPLTADMEAGEVAAHQIRMTVAGVWKTLEVKVTALPGADDSPGGRVVVLEDLTELLYAQKMAAWNDVARRIAHEIKNPLTPIKLTAERLLRKHQKQDPRLGEHLEEGMEVIGAEVATLKNMVDEFSRYARMPRPQPREVDLERFIHETVSLYRGVKPGIDVESRVAEDAATAHFDPDQLKSVLTNLLDNAVEALQSPGEVVVSTARSNGAVLLHVADNGPGIPARDRDKVFLPYYSTKGRGTGLGLAIVQRIVAEHHARLRVDDNKPQGTVFTLEIPLH